MSLIEDSLLIEKLEAVKQAQNALNEEKSNYYVVLGEWLENALQGDNQQLKDYFINESENTKYLKRKNDRSIAKKIADKLSAMNKSQSSNHVQNIIKNNGQHNADLDLN